MPTGSREPSVVRMAEAARLMQQQDDLEATYQIAVVLTQKNVTHCEAASLTLAGPKGTLTSRFSTSEVAGRASASQHATGEGPSLDAARHQFVVVSHDVGRDRRWPRWGPRMVEAGVRSVLSLRLFSAARTLGSLTMYAGQPHAFDDEDRSDGVAIAAHVAIAVSAVQTETGLDSALESRMVIGQATGILMERYGINARAAFATLQRVSSETETRLRDVAVHLVATGVLSVGPEVARPDALGEEQAAAEDEAG